jgi:hypothetical protein
MARGWGSKAVEAQQDQAAEKARDRRPELTVEQRLALERRRTLELARARTLADLESATAERHRAMLQQALSDIDAQLRHEVDPPA